MNYAPDLWHGFAVTVGGLAGALTGLLFVALSIKGEALAASVSLRSRAAQTLVLFVTPAIAAIVVVAPQPRLGVGAELLVLGAISGAALFVLDRRAGHDVQNSVARYVERASPNTVTAVLTGIAGLTVMLRAGGGFYWLIPGCWPAWSAALSTRGCSCSGCPAGAGMPGVPSAQRVTARDELLQRHLPRTLAPRREPIVSRRGASSATSAPRMAHQAIVDRHRR